MSVVNPVINPITGPKIKPIILIGKPAKDNLKDGKEVIATKRVPMITNEIDIAIKIAIKAILLESHLFIKLLKYSNVFHINNIY